MLQFVSPRHPKSSVLLRLGEFPFLIFSLPLSGVITNKHWPLQYKGAKVVKFGGQNWLKGLQMVHFECERHPIPSVSLWL